MVYPTNKRVKFYSAKMSDEQLEQELTLKLGLGPMRFGPVSQERSVQAEAEAQGLSTEDIHSFAAIKAGWDTECKKQAKKKRFTSGQVLRFAIFAKFDEARAIKIMKNTDPRHFEMTAVDIETQLRSKTLFPVPGLKTLEGSNVFYMRPSRFVPNQMSTSSVIDNLIYVMNSVVVKENSKTGLSFMANMTGWTMANFSGDYCMKFMQCLQGRSFPAKVDMFLIVNPPQWFDKIWGIMKTMLSSSFRQKVHMVTEDDIGFYLEFGYEEYLPDEFHEGRASTEEMVEDYVMFQQLLEQETAATKRGVRFSGREQSNPLNQKRKGVGSIFRSLGLGASSQTMDSAELTASEDLEC
jgi:hypothetical protein